MTPYEIKVLLHYHTCADDHPDLLRNPPIWRPTMESLISLDLLGRTLESPQISTAAYEITDRGRVYCDRLTAIVLPTQTWGLSAMSPVVHTIEAADNETIEIRWWRRRQDPQDPTKVLTEILTERHTAPPTPVWEAKRPRSQEPTLPYD